MRGPAVAVWLRRHWPHVRALGRKQAALCLGRAVHGLCVPPTPQWLLRRS